MLLTVSLVAARVVACDDRDPFAPDGPSFAKGSTSKLAAPSATRAIPVLSTRVDVTWTDNSTGEGAFRVERSSDGGATWVTAGVVPENTGAFADTSRTPEQRLCYRVLATMGQGNGAASPPSPTDCTTPPAVPTGLTAAPVNSYTIDLSWKDNSSVEDGYELLRNGFNIASAVRSGANRGNGRDELLKVRWMPRAHVCRLGSLSI